MGTRPTKAKDNIFCKARLDAARYNDKLKAGQELLKRLDMHLNQQYLIGNLVLACRRRKQY